MKKRMLVGVAAVALVSCVSISEATPLFQDDFETAWSGDYAPGWVNAAYRHGEAPVGNMMQQTAISHSGNYGMKLSAASVPDAWMWWAAVEVENLESWKLDKQYNPYVSVWYYDDLIAGRTGQVYAVPDWVNPYLAGGEDWTDVQFGARFNQPADADYFKVAAGEASPGWQDTGVQRSEGWHQLKFQLNSASGSIDFYIDGLSVGQSYRNDYTNLGTSIGLYTMFQNPLSDWSSSPYTIWDDFEVGSSAPVPEPGTMLLLGTGLAGLAGSRIRRKKKG